MPDVATFQSAFGAMLAERCAVEDPRLSRALSVHRNTAAKAARDALIANHPVCRMLLGDEAFDALAAEFVHFSPPSEPRLCLYGDGFAARLAAQPALADISYVADVAKLERLVVEALFSADAPPLDGVGIMRGLDLAAPLGLHPAARWMSFATPAASIWQAHQAEAASDALESISWETECALVTRPGDTVMVTVVTRDALPFLDACAGGRPLSEAAACVGDNLSILFTTLIAAGAFA